MFSHDLLRAVLAISAFLSITANAHTWVEQLSVIAANGTMVGTPGFPRGNVLRTAPNFGDGLMVNLIPPNGGTVNVIASDQLMCMSSQTAQSQTSGSPRLSAAPGAMVALRYQENGHVTLPQNQPGKPSNRGTNYVYYTTQSQATDKFLGIHRQWTADGTGGDGKGQLISTQNFDDGQCYQVNSGQISTQRQSTFKHTANNLMGGDLWCQQDIQIPSDAKAGSTITLYWVWDWPTMPGTAGFEAGKQEIYTTCMDIDIVADNAGTSNAAAQGYIQQDYVSAAASAEFVNIANPTAVVSPQTIPFSGVATGSGTAATASVKSVAPAANSATPIAGSAMSVASSATGNVGTGFTTLKTSGVVSTGSAPTAAADTSVTTSKAAQVTSTSIATIASQASAALETVASSFIQGHGSGRPTYSGVQGTHTVYHTDSVTATSTDFQATATPQGMSATTTSTSASPSSTTADQHIPIPPKFSPHTQTLTSSLSATSQAAAGNVVTQFETDMVTHTRYNTLTARQESESISSTSSVMTKQLTTTSSVPEPSASSSSPMKACSKTEAAFRLRARMPFYIVQEGEGSSAGC